MDLYSTSRPQNFSPKRSDYRYHSSDGLSPLRSPLSSKTSEPDSKKHRPSRKVVHSQPDSNVRAGKKKTPSWADLVESEEERQDIVRHDLMQYRDEMLQRHHKFSESSSGSSSQDLEQDMETDETVLMRRQKQIDYGKCSEAYNGYSTAVSKSHRRRGQHPTTPNKFKKCSRRAWDGMVRAWRLQLHRVNDSLKLSTPRTRSDSLTSNSYTPSTEGATSGTDTSSPHSDRSSRKQLFI